FVASRSVACELDATHKELLALIHINIEEDQLLVFVKAGIGNRGKVDVAQLAVGIAEILESFTYLFAAENIAILQRKEASQGFDVSHCLVVFKGNPAQVVTLTLFDWHGDVHRFARPLHDQRDMKVLVSGVVDLCLRILYQYFEITTILILL